MQNERNSFFSTLNELKEWLLNVHEKYYVELKKAQELPASGLSQSYLHLNMRTKSHIYHGIRGTSSN